MPHSLPDEKTRNSGILWSGILSKRINRTVSGSTLSGEFGILK